MKKKLLISGVILAVLIVLGVGYWAFKTGKLAGLADVVKTIPSPSQTIVPSATPTYTDYPTPETGGIRGKVIDSHGVGIMLAEVSLYDAQGNPTGNNDTTHSDGTFYFENLNPATYKAIARKTNYNNGERTGLNVQAGKILDNIIIILPGAASPSVSSSPKPSPDPQKLIFAARIEGTGGQLISNVQVRITSSRFPGYTWTGTSWSKPVDESKYGNNNLVITNISRFEVCGPVPANPSYYVYNVTIEQPEYEGPANYAFSCNQVYLNSTLNSYYYQASTIILIKKEGTDISGKITTFAGSDLPGAMVRIINENYPSVYYETTTGSNGGFQFKGLPLDPDYRFRLEVSSPGYTTYQRSELGDSSFWHNPINVYLVNNQKGYLEGTVTDVDTKKPVKDAVISLIFNGATLPGSGTKTNTEGKYKIGDLEPGRYSVFVYHPFYNDSRNLKEVEIKKGKISQKDFELKVISTIKRYDLFVQLLDENGKPFDIGQTIKKSEVVVMVKDVLSPELYLNGKPELVFKNGKQYYRFNFIPCGRQENVWAKISHLFEINGEKYSTVVADEDVNYSCSQDGEEKFLDILLKRLSINDPVPDDPKKPNISGDVYLANDCRQQPIAFDDLKENINVVIQKQGGIDYISVELDPWGSYEIKDVEPGVYEIFVLGNNFQQVSSIVHVKDQDIIHNIPVILKDSQSYTKKITLNGIDLYFVGPMAQSYQDKFDWNEYTRRFALLPQSVKSGIIPEPETVPIYIADAEFLGAFYSASGCSIIGVQGPFIEINSNYISTDPDLWGTLMHEYAHHIYDGISTGNNLKINWNTLFNTAKKSADKDCVFAAIKDSNISQYFDRGGHPQDNDKEFFASFFVAYFDHHDRLLQLIRSLPEGSDCRNILEYAWQLYSEKIAEAPGETISSVQAQWPRLYSNDNALFIPIGGKIGITYYSSYQIEKGLWKQSTYNQSSAGQKISVQITRTVSSIYKLLKTDPSKVRTNILLTVARFNQFIDSLYPGGNRGSVEGTVYEQVNGTTQGEPKANAIVIIGKKMAVTNNEGKFKINSIRTGKQTIGVVDGTNRKNLETDIKEVNIQKDATIALLLNIK